jgi:hypothetical protein
MFLQKNCITQEPDQAIVAQKDGYCFVAFRGTTMTWIDWQQNFELGKELICATAAAGVEEEEENNDANDGGDDVTSDCCSTRTGFYKAYMTPSYKDELEESIRSCAMTCPLERKEDECVIFTGHSQGGAIAAVAGVVLADLNPYVITFGQPNTIDAPCDLITSERWYRFVNTKSTDTVGISYDPVPFVPGMGTDSFGHLILLGEDPSGVAYVGLDAQTSFGPLNTLGFEAHSMIHADGVPYAGYMDRLEALLNEPNHTWPIRASGYKAGTLCSQGIECMSGKCGADTHLSFTRCIGIECDDDGDCDSGRCDEGSCRPKLGSCMPCDEDSDCDGGKCTLLHCSGSSGLMDNECICGFDSDCASGRCELFSSGVCEAQLSVGSSCNENSDCLSDYCSWAFRCEVAARTIHANAASTSSSAAAYSRGKTKGKKNIVVTVPVAAKDDGEEAPTPAKLKTTTLPPVPTKAAEEEKKNKVGYVWLVVIFGLLSCYFFATRWYIRRRQGYESISTELSV